MPAVSPRVKRWPTRWLPQRRQPRQHGWLTWSLLAVGLWIGWWTYRSHSHYVFEDAYITFRYAANLAAGHGFVFNPGERVLGTSTPLYTLILAALGKLGFDIAAAAAAVFSAGIVITAWLGGLLLRRWGGSTVGAAFALLVLWGAADIHRFFGMETSLLVALQVSALAAAAWRRPALAGVLGGLACLTRYDAVLFAGVLFCALWLAERRLPWRLAISGVIVVTPWLLFAQLYFGSVMPNTLGAKVQSVERATYLYESVALAAGRFFSPFTDGPKIVIALMLLAAIGPIFAHASTIFRRRPLSLVLLIYPLLLWLGYSLLAPPVAHGWYHLPPLYFLLMLSLLAWQLTLTAGVGGYRPTRRKLALVAILLSIVATVLLLPSALSRSYDGKTQTAFYRQRVGAYGLLAQWVQDQQVTDLTVLMREPGYFSYSSGSPVIDAAGLVSEDIYFHGPEERRTSIPKLIAERQPDLAIFPNAPWEVARLTDFLPLFHTMPKRSLFVARETLRQRLDDLARPWRRRDFYHPAGDVDIGHPWSVDFVADGNNDVDYPDSANGGFRSGGPDPRIAIEAAPNLRLEGQPIDDSLVASHRHVPGRLDPVISPLFRIDFDELRFLFGGTDRRQTSVELLVNGLVVLSRDARHLQANEMIEVRWPLHTWRGQVGLLRLADRSRRGYSMLGRVRSHRYSAKTVLEDFESPSSQSTQSAFWRQRFTTERVPFGRLAVEHGLNATVGEFSAVSWFDDGPQIMSSRPFTVEYDELAMTVFDFGDRRTRIEMRVGDQVVRQWLGSDSTQLDTIVWSVAELRGQEVTLTVIDRDPRPGRGTGIDDLLGFDP